MVRKKTKFLIEKRKIKVKFVFQKTQDGGLTGHKSAYKNIPLHIKYIINNM